MARSCRLVYNIEMGGSTEHTPHPSSTTCPNGVPTQSLAHGRAKPKDNGMVTSPSRQAMVRMSAHGTITRLAAIKYLVAPNHIRYIRQ